MPTRKRFRRVGSSRSQDLDDARGRVTISIRLTQPGGRVIAGNVSRTISVEGRVSEVAAAIEAICEEAE